MILVARDGSQIKFLMDWCLPRTSQWKMLIVRKPLERLRDERNISAYEGWSVLKFTQPQTRLIMVHLFYFVMFRCCKTKAQGSILAQLTHGRFGKSNTWRNYPISIKSCHDFHYFKLSIRITTFWPRATLKGPRRSFVVLVGVESS